MNNRDEIKQELIGLGFNVNSKGIAYFIDAIEYIKENTYKLNIQYDDVLKSKTLVRKIKKIIERRKKYDSSTNKAKMVRYDKKWREKGRI